jgi:uncharacterized membrane protein
MLAGLVARLTERFAQRFYGRTFRCPVCHLALATIDADGNRLLVCPVCGAVLEIDEVYGHVVPVVIDMELWRPQPTARLHPLATHLPIGLFPFALLGAVALLVLSLLRGVAPAAVPARLLAGAPLLADGVLVLLVIAVSFAALTFASGWWDWTFRFRQRPYRQIRLKIAFSLVFVVLGALAIALHASGLVFAGGSGLVESGSFAVLAATLAYVAILLVEMAVIATLGHVGGTLVFGR